MFPVVVFFFAYKYTASELLLYIFCIESIFVGLVAWWKRSVPDLIFFSMVGYVVGLQVISLALWPEFSVYQQGDFFITSVSASAIDRSLSLLLAFSLGWCIVMLFDKNKVDIGLIRHEFQSLPLVFCLWWFAISVVATAFGTLFLDIGIAGIDSDFQGTGFLYYLFPVDYLAMALTVAIGLEVREIENKKRVLWILIAIYLAVKIMSGWKGVVLNILLAYIIGAYYTGRIKSAGRLVLLFIIVVSGYFFIVKPVTNFVRTGELFVNDYVEGTINDNPLAGRLTMGTLYGLAVIDSGGSGDELGWEYFMKDIVNRLVPGTIWEIKSFDRVFTEDVLGQSEGVSSTFAPGILGMAEMLGGILSAFMYGVFFRLLVLLLIWWSSYTREIFVKLLLLGGIPLFIISLSTDGYSGGVEKLVLVGVVVSLILKTRIYFKF
ncbi:MAG: hypothetical protein ACYCZ6_12635 [Polaromonas sp.]